MTAEIGILNRQGVALAADSAVTISRNGKQKVLNSANKLFNLIKGYPIGLMLYNNGSFLGIPWDVIIDDYRRKYDRKKQFDTVFEYADDFFKKLNDTKYFSNDAYNIKCFSNLNTLILEIIEKTTKDLSGKYPNRDITQEEARNSFNEHLNEYVAYLGNLDFCDRFNSDDLEIIIKNPNSKMIVQSCLTRNVVFGITEEIESKVSDINAMLQCKNVFLDYSGIVISGYGESELFPSLYEFCVEGIINGKIKYKLVKQSQISSRQPSEIIPFAQQEMVQTILNGIDPNLNQVLTSNLSMFVEQLGGKAKDIFNCNDCRINDKQIEQIKKESTEELVKMMNFINKQSKEKYTDPVLNMVSSLPKDELASMAETLVNLTSFKRKITMDAETVGGPIDVAIISKSEGFIWMKRKLYFSKELNSYYDLYNKDKGGIYSE